MYKRCTLVTLFIVYKSKQSNRMRWNVCNCASHHNVCLYKMDILLLRTLLYIYEYDGCLTIDAALFHRVTKKKFSVIKYLILLFEIVNNR